MEARSGGSRLAKRRFTAILGDIKGAVQEIQSMGRPNSRSEWLSESKKKLKYVEEAFKIAVFPLIGETPRRVQIERGYVDIRSDDYSERCERELCDAFFLRLKGLTEARLMCVPGCGKPDWRSACRLLESVGVSPEALLKKDKDRLDDLCALRNCIAHNDGRVDGVIAAKIPQLRGPDVWMNRDCITTWCELIGRLFDAIGASSEDNAG